MTESRSQTTTARRLPWAREVLVLLQKELRIEAQQQLRARALLPFGLLILLLFSFAVGPQAKLLARLTGALLWLAILFASVQLLGESMRIERADGALEGLRLLGIRAHCLFVAKAMSNALFVFVLGCVLLPASIGLFDAPLRGDVSQVVLILALGALALSAPGTLFAALASEARAKELLLPLLLFPLLVPVLLSSVRATDLALSGDPMAELGLWLGLLFTFNLVFWPLSALLFERVVET